MKIMYAALTMVLISLTAAGQVQVGYYFDLDGNPIMGIFDNIDYKPINSLKIYSESQVFEAGYYYDQNNVKVDGLIQLKDYKILYKKTTVDQKLKFKPTEVRSFVVGVDSFFVTNNYKMKKQLSSSFIEDENYFQYITTIDDLVFAKQYDFVNKQTSSSTYQVKQKEADSWTCFSDKQKKFQEVALQYFGHLSGVKEKLEDADLTESDMMRLIKTLDYQYRFEQNLPIYVDAYWNEVNKQDQATYTAKIVSKVDSTWTIEYYDNELKLYSVQYSAFYPNVKDGSLIAYDAMGQKRKETKYEENEWKNTKVYDQDGVLSFWYFPDEDKLERGDKGANIYRNAGGMDKSNTITTGTSSLEFFDSIQKRKIKFEFENEELIRAYRTSNDRKIYQLTGGTYDLVTKRLADKFGKFLEYEKFENAIADNASGALLVAMVIGESGYVEEYKILNTLHPEVDQKIYTFLLSNMATTAKFPLKFKPVKIDGEKIAIEVVVPIMFNISRPYRVPNYYYNDMFWLHQQMMQQQFINNIPVPTPPTPSFY